MFGSKLKLVCSLYQLAIYSVSSVVKSTVFPPRWPVRPCFEPFRHIFYFFAMRFSAASV